MKPTQFKRILETNRLEDMDQIFTGDDNGYDTSQYKNPILLYDESDELLILSLDGVIHYIDINKVSSVSFKIKPELKEVPHGMS